MAHRKLLFGLAAAVIAVDVTSLSVAILGPAVIMSNVVVGVTVAVSILVANDAKARKYQNSSKTVTAAKVTNQHFN